MNISECSKKFKELGERCTALAKKEARIAKEYNKLMSTFSSLNEAVIESKKNINATKRKQQKIDALQKIYDERQEEVKKVKEEIEVIQNKIDNLYKHENVDEKNKAVLQRFMKMQLVKILTKTHISQADSKVIRGFSVNTETSQIFPFEIETGSKTRAEIEEALWEQTRRGGELDKQSEELFKSLIHNYNDK